jgi:hypothetical protein
MKNPSKMRQKQTRDRLMQALCECASFDDEEVRLSWFFMLFSGFMHFWYFLCFFGVFWVFFYVFMLFFVLFYAFLCFLCFFFASF